MATLRVYRGDQFVAPFELGDSRVRLGRGTENQLVLEDRDKQVSRTHAEIRFERGQYFITDLNSQNGVWIAERQIKAEEILPPNVPVTIGPYRLILQADEPAAVDLPVSAVDLDPGGIEPTMLDEMPAAPAPPPARSAAAPPPPSRSVSMPPPAPAPPATPPAAAAPSRTQTGKTTGKTATPAATGGNRAVLIGGAAAVVVLAVLGYVFFGRSKPPEATVAVVDTSTSSSSTTTTIPAAPTPEDVFLDHYNKAQTLIGEKNKTAARDENTAALAALPNDPRGLEQLKAIEALVDPNAPAATTTAPVKQAATGPESLRVQARAGEPERDRANREKSARAQLDEGRKALAEHRLDAAITALGSAISLSGRADFGAEANEASSMLARAKKEQGAAIAAARRAAAEKALAEARALAGSDIPAAWQKLVQARGLDQSVEGIAELQSTLQEQARVQGESAMASAKNLDARNRGPQAIAEYEKAVRLFEILPGGHNDLALARQRLAVLKK